MLVTKPFVWTWNERVPSYAQAQALTNSSVQTARARSAVGSAIPVMAAMASRRCPELHCECVVGRYWCWPASSTMSK